MFYYCWLNMLSMITVHTPESTWLMTEQLITNTDQLTICVWIVVSWFIYIICVFWSTEVDDVLYDMCLIMFEYMCLIVIMKELGLYNVEVWLNFSFISWLCLSCLRRKIRGKKPGKDQFNSGSRKERFFSWGFCNIRQFVISDMMWRVRTLSL